jgi:nucleotide-binding universal stress UspA family protein
LIGLLAGEFSAELFVAHVLEDNPEDEGAIPSWRRPPDLADVARRQLRQDVGSVARKATILIEQGKPAEAIPGVAEREGCDLIVTGVAKDELLGRFSLGATVNGILRSSQTPVLVVRSRAARAYDPVVVATDFSACSRDALDTAATYFPDRKLTLFHAYDAPMSMLLSDPESYRRERQEAARREGEGFLRSAGRARDTLPVEYGVPDQLLREFVLEKNMDLVVLGTHGRGSVLELFIGSVPESKASGTNSFGAKRESASASA